LAFVVFLMPACQDTGEVVVTSVRLAKGDFRNISWGGAQVERFHVVARQGANDEAVIWSPDHPHACTLGDVAWYAAMQPLRSGGVAWGALGTGIVPFIESFDEQGRGTLRFAGIDCTPLPLQVADVKRSELWTIYDDSLAKPTYVSLTSDQHLIFADPWRDSEQLVASGVAAVAPVDSGLWLLEGGQAVMRDPKGKELARTGHDVQELAIIVDQEIAYVDRDGVSVFDIDRGQKHIAKDACGPRSLSGFSTDTLAYFSPCDARRFVIDDGHGHKRVVAEGVADVVSDPAWLLYTRTEETTTSLWLASVQNAKDNGTRIMERDNLALDRAWRIGGSMLMLSIAQTDDRVELWELDPKHKTIKQVDRDVTSLRIGLDSYVTVHADGTLLQVRRSDRRVLHRASEVSATSVRFMFGESSTALGYLARVDPDSKLGRLELRFMDTGAQYEIASGVREFREVWWPETGIVYGTGPGKNQGLWFARVDVPCEKTTDTPWACAF
jgi:hypothetical protein